MPIRAGLLLVLLVLLSPIPARTQGAPFLDGFGPVWLEVASGSGSRISLDSATMFRSGDSTFFAATMIVFSDTLEAESGERFDREVDIQELDCGEERNRTFGVLLLAGDSLVASLQQDQRWAPVAERALPLFRLRCGFLLGSFLMATPPVATVAEVEQLPALLNASGVRRALERLYPRFARSGRAEGTIQASFVIDVEGRPIPGSMRIVTSDIARQDAHDVVLRLLPSLRFRPARVRRVPVPIRIEIPITFQASGEPLFPDQVPGPPGNRPRSWPGEW